MSTENTNIQIIGALPTKANASIFAAEIVRQCQSGEADTLKTLTHFKAIEEAIKIAREKLVATALEAIEPYGKAGATALGAKIEQMEGGIKYDYSGCPIWVKLNETAETAIEERKAREEILKKIQKPLHEVDPETGESHECLPAIKSSTTTIKITLAKS